MGEESGVGVGCEGDFLGEATAVEPGLAVGPTGGEGGTVGDPLGRPVTGEDGAQDGEFEGEVEADRGFLGVLFRDDSEVGVHKNRGLFEIAVNSGACFRGMKS